MLMPAPDASRCDATGQDAVVPPNGRPDPWSRFAGVRGSGPVGEAWRVAAADVDAGLAAWRASSDALLAAVRRGDTSEQVRLEARCAELHAALLQAVARQRAARNSFLTHWLRRADDDPERP